MAKSALLLGSLVVFGAVCVAQDTQNLPQLQRVNIPLSLNEERRYVADVNMSGGETSQRFRFALVGNTGYNGVANVTCDGCNDAPAYVMAGSPSARPLVGTTSLNLGASIATGSFIKENCSLQTDTGSAWAYPNQTIVLVNSSSSFFTKSTSGFLGLGTNANGQSGDFADTIFGGWLSRNPARSNFSFGMALRSPDDPQSSTDGGVLHWVVPDSSAYEGAVAQVPAQVSAQSQISPNDNTNRGVALPESDWRVAIEQWSASYDGGAVTNTSTSQMAVLEPWVPDIIFPMSQATLYYSLIAGASMQSQLVNNSHVWSVPCDAAPSLSFSFSNENFAFNNLVIRNNDGSCLGAVQAWPDDTNEFLLGSRFLSAFYLIFTIGRPDSGIPNSIGFARRSQGKSSTNVGAIVGGVVGGVVFAIVLGAAAYAFYLRRRRRRAQVLPSAAVPSLYRDDAERRTSGGESNPEKIMKDVRVRESIISDDGVQYASHRPVSYATTNGQYMTPPHSARSQESNRPLLPEPQSPLSPSLDVPHSAAPHRSMTTTMAPPLSQAVSSHATGDSAVQTNGQNFLIAPFVLSQSASGDGQNPRDSKTAIQQVRRFSDVAAASASSHSEPAPSVNPPSSVTDSTGATLEPFVLPPPPRAAAADRKGPIPHHAVEAPAPPAYTPRDPASDVSGEHGNGADTGLGDSEGGTGLNSQHTFSPTLVEYSPSTNANRESSHIA